MTTMLATAAKLACSDIYAPVTIDSFAKVYASNEDVAGLALIDGVQYVAFAGTENVMGWLDDFDVLPYYHPRLGNLEKGFYRNIPDFVGQITPDLDRELPVVVTGHSRGAAMAAIFAAELALLAISMKGVHAVLFACPRPGYQRFADFMRANIDGASYRNGPDPVPEVPPSPFVDPYPHIAMNVPPGGAEDILPIAWHKGNLYQAGIVYKE